MRDLSAQRVQLRAAGRFSTLETCLPHPYICIYICIFIWRINERQIGFYPDLESMSHHSLHYFYTSNTTTSETTSIEV